ncbi:MAG: hypothetical protein R3Y39_04635 [Rikenellaceae bacterium]
MELTTIFIPIGITIVGVSIVAMLIIYNRTIRKSRGYVNGRKYEEDDDLNQEKLMDIIPQYGSLLLIGFVMIILSWVITAAS